MGLLQASGLNIVSIGGGTGLSTLLSGLKDYVGTRIESLTAIVTVTDDGGSSGRLREEFQILPPGDIRNCMVALAEDEHLLTKLFQYRFESEGDLSGHSFGNIFLTALTAVTGDFLEAIKMTSEVLAIKGRIFPSTMEDIALVAELDDGNIVEGETHIVASRRRINRLWLSRKHSKPLPETLQAIKQADVITIGPGSLYTSIIPNLLVDGIVEALRDSAALKIYVSNIMTQPGETEGFSGEDHLRALYKHSPDLQIDYVIVNSAPIHEHMREKYRADGAVQVEFESLSGQGPWQNVTVAVDPETSVSFRAVMADLLSEKAVVRHDPHKLARLIFDIYHCERMQVPATTLPDS
jgi:uncharacterized cofD-like protein